MEELEVRGIFGLVYLTRQRMVREGGCYLRHGEPGNHFGHSSVYFLRFDPSPSNPIVLPLPLLFWVTLTSQKIKTIVSW